MAVERADCAARPRAGDTVIAYADRPSVAVRAGVYMCGTAPVPGALGSHAGVDTQEPVAHRDGNRFQL